MGEDCELFETIEISKMIIYWWYCIKNGCYSIIRGYYFVQKIIQTTASYQLY